MNLFNIHREFSDREPPVRIPDVETSWKQMAERLDKEMPRHKIFDLHHLFGEEHFDVRRLLLVIGLLFAVLPIKHSITQQKLKDFTTADKKNYTSDIKKQAAAEYGNFLSPTGNNRNIRNRIPRHKFANSPYDEQRNQAQKTASRGSQDEPLKFVDSSLTQAPATSHPLKKDSLFSPNETTPLNSIVNEEDVVELQAGLLWNFQIPTSNPAFYLMGPTGLNQPYRLLLPGAWLSLKSHYSLFTMEVSPFFTTLLPNKPFVQTSSTQVVADTLINTYHANTLRKLFCIDAGFGYDQRLNKNWWVGGGIHFSWWSEGLATEDFSQSKNPLNDPTHATSLSTERNYQLDAKGWQDFSKFQTMVYVEWMYRKKFIQTGIRLGLFAMPLSKSAGPTNPLTLQYFFKLSLFSSRNKSNQLFYSHKKSADSD